MFEDAIGAAAKSLASTTLGALLFLLLVGYYFTVKMLRQDIEKVEAELKKERDDHEKTRQEQKQDLRSLGNVVIAVDRMRDALIDNSLGRRAP
ncbi:hypothetical protein [Rhizobium sp. HT1-10]|uniref:hypothetical protein n=1 Tax=Rhizobium sp. HT1-10 TaxID=3111638 RepID=UPI003C18D72F